VVGIAPTGTGKTLAYLLPLLRKISHAQGHTPRLLVLTPTRELALQVNQTAEKLSKYTDLRVLAIYGGLGPKTQKEKLAGGVDVLIATPGRCMELYFSGSLEVHTIRHLVIDEADRMMDMGFMPQLRKLFEILPRKRQHILCSATMPDKVERFIAEFIDFPERIEAAPQATVAYTIAHSVMLVPNYMSKIKLLEHLLQENRGARILIFARTRSTAEEVFRFVRRKLDSSVRVIHANKGQNTRINAMDAFKEGDVRCLVATDIAARGIDVSGVDIVVNLDVPLIPEEYIHRIGRTGRAGLSGKAITLVAPNDLPRIRKVEHLIGSSIELVPLPQTLVLPNTEKEESIAIARDLDTQKKKADPSFKGAFHEKKRTKRLKVKGDLTKPKGQRKADSNKKTIRKR
jgi:ATP-dependent RNA helicase RhlE